MTGPNKRSRMPRSVQRRIAERAAKGEVSVVVPREGTPSRVYTLDKYLKMMEQPRKHKPWSYRKKPTTTPDPLGAVDGSVHSTLKRGDIYD